MNKTTLLCGLAVFAATAGCDKVKDLIAQKAAAADGGAATASSGAGTGGGILSSLLGSSFEGEITADATTKDAGKAKTTTLVFGLKNPKQRIDVSGDIAAGNPMMAQGASLIVDGPAKKLYALVPAKKQAVVIDLDKMKSMKIPSMSGPSGPSHPGAPSVPSEPPKIQDTGKKDTVAGYQCEIWTVTSKDSHAEACLADGISWIDLSSLGMGNPIMTAAAAVTGLNHFPLRVVSYDAKNVEDARLEAKKIEKKTLDASRFTVPADYKVVDLGAMMGAFMGGPAGAPGAKPGMPPGFPPPHRTR